MIVTKRKKRRSKAEEAVHSHLTEKGVEFLTKGWPDLLCQHNGEVLCIEIKRHEFQNLTRQQEAVMRTLHSLGVRCVRWDPMRGFRGLDGAYIHDLTIGGLDISSIQPVD